MSVDVEPAGTDRSALGRSARRAYAVLARPTLLIFLVALAARTARNLVGGGFTEPNGYDPGVYYAAAAGLANGKIPYRDFTLVHPPGIALIEAPFALLGRLTTDLTGYAAATIAIVVMASVSAVLVVQVARAMGLPERAAITAGLIYALWTNAVAFEFVGRLEPVGNFFLLCGLLAFYRALDADGPWARRLWLLSGAALGAAVCIKLWWIVPIAVFLGWQLVGERRWRAVRTAAIGGAASLILVDGPFFLLAGRKMWDMIVLDQLSRPENSAHRPQIFSYLSIGTWSADASERQLQLIAVAGTALLAGVLWRAWRYRPARPVVLLLVAQLVQIWFQPVWYPFYADFVTVGLCLVVGAALRSPSGRRGHHVERSWVRRNWVPATVVAALATSTTAFLITWAPGPDASPTPLPRKELSAAVAGLRCVTSDQPMGLIQLNRLSSNFQRGCRTWVDPVGRHLALFRALGPASRPVAAQAWSKLYTRYLVSGEAVLFTRPPELLGLTPAAVTRLQRDGVLVEVGGYTIYRTSPGS